MPAGGRLLRGSAWSRRGGPEQTSKVRGGGGRPETLAPASASQSSDWAKPDPLGTATSRSATSQSAACAAACTASPPHKWANIGNRGLSGPRASCCATSTSARCADPRRSPSSVRPNRARVLGDTTFESRVRASAPSKFDLPSRFGPRQAPNTC